MDLRWQSMEPTQIQYHKDPQEFHQRSTLEPSMQTIRSTKEQISFKQHEAYLQDTRDQLCKHYRLNKSDLIKFLIKKESCILKQPQETWSYQ